MLRSEDLAPELTPEQKLYEAKENARSFYQNLKVPQRTQKILNDILYDKPHDVYGRLSEFFEEFQLTPKLEDLKVEVILDSNGNFALRGKVFSFVKNHLKMLSRTELSIQKELLYRNQPETIPTEPSGEAEESAAGENEEHHQACVRVVQETLLPALKGISIFKQAKVDETIRKAIDETEAPLLKVEEETIAKRRAEEELLRANDPPADGNQKSQKGKGSGKGKKSAKGGKKSAKGGGGNKPDQGCQTQKKSQELRLQGCSAACLASFSVLRAAANFHDVQPYCVIRQLRTALNNDPQQLSSDHFTLPMPMASIICANFESPGKVNFIKNLLIFGKPERTAEENIMAISKVYATLGNLLSKTHGNATTSDGSYVSTLEKYEVLMGVVTEAMTNAGRMPGEDVFIALHLDATAMFDYNKGVYEVQQGQTKTSEELVDFYAELVDKFTPTLRMLIDPFTREDSCIFLHKLSQVVSSRCLVVASDNLIGSAHSWTKERVYDREEETMCNGLAVTLGGHLTCSDVTKAVLRAGKRHVTTVVQPSQSETCDNMITDLAVGVQSTFLRVGAPSRGENVSRLNRLIEIERSLQDDERIKLVYPSELHIKNLEPEEVSAEN